jgi:predicted peptidase
VAGRYAVDVEHLLESRFAYFRAFRPRHQVGSAIFIYEITPEQAAAAHGHPATPSVTPAPEEENSLDQRGLVYRDFKNTRGTLYHYAVFIPPEYRGDRAWPVILFLHGYGDRGSTGRQYTAVGLPPALERLKKGFGFFVVCPQGHSGGWSRGGEDASTALEILAAVEREFRIDTSREYLTGLSSGGMGVWELVARESRRWAALVTVSASGPVQLANLFHEIPCWCFHNSHDSAESVHSIRQMIQALRDAGGQPRYTEYIGLDHNAWDRAYATGELYDWLIGQRRRERISQ